jgi:acetyl-CoA hydrolase
MRSIKGSKAMTIEMAPDALDLTHILCPGDHVMWGQGTSEPLTLTEALVRQRAGIGRVNVFLGPTFSKTLQPEHCDHISFTSYGGFGNNQRLSAAGVLDVLPCHYSPLPE